MKKLPFPILLVFMVMGLGDLAAPLTGLAKDAFQLTNFQAQFVCFAGFVMLGLLPLSLTRLLSLLGLKLTLLLGLALAFTALAIAVLSGLYGNVAGANALPPGLYYVLLFVMLLLGAAVSIFSVAGLGLFSGRFSAEDISSSQSVGMTFRDLGSSVALLLPAFAMHFLGLGWTIIFPAYLLLVVIIWMFVALDKGFEKGLPTAKPLRFASCVALFSDTRVALMAIAMFLYAGAEVCMFSGLPMFLHEKTGFADVGLWITWLLFFLPLAAGRMLGPLLLKRIQLQPFLLLSAFVAFTGILLLTIGKGMVVMPGIVLAGLGFSNIPSLIFLLTGQHVPEKTPELNLIFITALAGGAILPLLMGLIADAGENVAMGFIAPLFAILYIFFLSIVSRPANLAVKEA